MLVDDEENIIKALQRVLRREKDWEVESYSSVHDAVKRAKTANFDLILSDYRMPEMDGVEFLTAVKEFQPSAMRIILSGFTDLEALMGAINQAEIYRFICKPWQDNDLLISIKQALKHHDILLENKILADQVRHQEKELKRRESALNKIQDKHPELMKVNWSADGSIILDDNDI